MTIQHASIPDAQLHEPKGVATAASGTAYIANGAGSGSWTAVQLAQGGCLKMVSAGATTLVSNAFQAINNATLGGTITFTENAAFGSVTTNTTSGYMVVPATGHYGLVFSISILPATINSTFTFTFGVDSGAGIVEKSAFAQSIISTSGTSDSANATLACIPSLTANDKLYILVKEAAGNEMTIKSGNFTITRVS